MTGMNLKNIVKSLAAEKNTNIPKIAESCKKKPANLHQQLDRNNMTMKQLKILFKAMGEDVVFVTKSGNKFKYE
jgi:hypothetical protein